MLKRFFLRHMAVAATLFIATISGAAPAEARSRLADQPVVVSFDSFRSTDPHDVVYSNVAFLNALFDNHVDVDEIPRDALRSYYVDYYFYQIRNGGFAQFVHQSGLDPDLVALIRDALKTIGAQQNLAVFNKGVSVAQSLSKAELTAFFKSDPFAPNAARDRLNSVNDALNALTETENLIELNSVWLRGLPNLQLKSAEELNAELERRVAMIPNLAKRKAQALEDEPRHMKLIRAVVKKAGQTFSHMTATDPNHEHRGRKTVAWHFMTDQGQHFVIEIDGRVLMYRTKNRSKIEEMAAR